MKHKVAIVQKLIPPFRVPVFTALAREIDIIVCHSRKKKNRVKAVAEEAPFPNLYLKSFHYRNSETALVQDLSPLLFRVRPKIVICEFALGFASFWILLLTRRFFGFSLVFWTHAIKGNKLEAPFSTRRDRFRLCLLNRADAVITYSGQRSELLRHHLKDPGKVFLASNTLDTGSLLMLRESLEAEGRDKVKSELGFTHRFNLIFLGRILPNKEVGKLIQAFGAVARKHDVCLHIAGPGPTEDLQRIAAERDLPVRFHGAVYDEGQAGRLLFASDLMMMPGSVGLAIVHGFSFGLPILTTKAEPGLQSRHFHSPEIEYLHPGINGVICPRDSVAAALDELLSDPAGLERMGEEALRTAREECSLDNMVEGFRACVSYLSR